VASSAALQWLDSLQGSGIRPGLGRIRALLRALGRPHRTYPSIIVAGTNGKGSTSATLESILRASGYHTGIYTSPHLVDLRERWMIDGKPIENELLESSIWRLKDAADRINITPTYFEALTVIAFIAFETARCEVVVLEVGMGGRLDATNVIRPVAALITPIGLDHTEFLGNTVRKIAMEKAGVIHRGAIVLTSNSDPAVLAVLRKRAAHFSNAFHVVTGDEIGDTPLAGDFQKLNVALAARAAEELMQDLPKITRDSIARGIATTRWRGRLERIDVAGKQVWVDGCHNAHAAVAIAPFVDRALPRPRLLVFGIMGDKDVKAVTTTLFPLFDAIITTEPFPPRSMSSAILAAIARDRAIPVEAVPDPATAVRAALASRYETVFVGGSLYLAGAAIEVLDAERGEKNE
jgi:dihydrofolate synthase/folylpolyglutamate synthase